MPSNVWLLLIGLSHLVVAQNAQNNVNQPGAAPAQQAAAPGQQVPPESSKLVYQSDCQVDIQNHCKHVIGQLPPGQVLSDMAALECLQDAGVSDKNQLTQGCSQKVWEYKIMLTQDQRFIDAIKQFCEAEMKTHPKLAECTKDTRSGYAISCIMDVGNSVPRDSRCFQFLVRAERLAFSDFRLVAPFVEHCGETVAQLECGTLTKVSAHQGARYPHSQGQTLECLIDKMVNIPKDQAKANIVKNLSKECRQQVMRLAELQSEDFHMDRPLYFACREDRERFCSEIQAGDGRIFECLMKFKDDKMMEPQCSKMLSERAGLMGQNFHLAQPLLKECSNELKAHHCLPQVGFERSINFHLSWVLLCLENGRHRYEQQQHERQEAAKENRKIEQTAELMPFSPGCTHEMITHRQMMVQEFRMSPELVMNCAQEIDRFCSPTGDLETGGQTIHCLLEHAESRDANKQLGAQCMNSLQGLMKVADIGSNYKVDSVLYQSCRPLIEGKCKMDLESESKTLTCLMDHIDSDDMPPQCEQRLVEVQYFMARDWSLDPQLYDACHKEAVERCHAPNDWHKSDQNNPQAVVDPGPQVLACLYRSAYDEQKPLSHDCQLNVHRVLRERASRVNLISDVEENCRDALSEFCSHNVKPQEEMKCLQEEFEKPPFKEHYPHCYDELVKFTEMESKDTKLNRLLTRACRPVIDTYCTEMRDQEIDHGDVMTCLANHKDAQEMTPKCKSYVHHFELISMRDYHFSYRFTQSCQADINLHCNQFGNDKAAIIRCLSNIVFEHRVLGTQTDLDKECKKQLREAFRAQEKVNFDDKDHMKDADPQLMKHCESDLHRLQCAKLDTFEQIVECLREKFDQLSPPCKALVFARQEVEAADNSLDVELSKKCKFDINRHCPNQEGDRVLDCLSNTKIVRLLQRGCQEIVHERMLERVQDDRLNPSLLEACHDEASKYCPDEFRKINDASQKRESLGPIIATCLRAKFVEFKGQVHLGPKCKDEVTNLILEGEFDPSLDPPFYKACKSTISIHCSNIIITKSGNFDTVMECLKNDFYSNNIADRNCARELARRTRESLVDIHLDPSLHEACSVDINRLCRDVPAGQSRIITCLLEAMSFSNTKMSQTCRVKLEERQKLWNIAHDEYKMEIPETWADLVEVVSTHPHRWSILTYIGMLLVVILFIGCCCGRITKRAHSELKNR
ncbi:hypothetical protein M3Y94_01234100 [Aphelenchoides besseyi]|nr:hypothetical protein M3Y94_01234100 [Aphelenchoides besseyi]KAI6217542.1 Golgi apparatus protein 1-like protein [Aphelenchoides besseyi]